MLRSAPAWSLASADNVSFGPCLWSVWVALRPLGSSFVDRCALVPTVLFILSSLKVVTYPVNAISGAADANKLISVIYTVGYVKPRVPPG